MTRAPLALTCGDPAGIGPEITAGWLRAHLDQAQDIVCIGPRLWCERLLEVAPHLGVVPVGPKDFIPAPGRPSVAGAHVAREALEMAESGTRAGRFCAVVTNPIGKSWMAQAGFAFPGHTEFFAQRWGGEPVMGFVGERLRVVLATWHIPLAAVPEALTPEVLERSVRAASWLAQALGVAAPRLACCGLNPHAGEEGLLGMEERERLDPCLDTLRAAFPGLSRTLPADTVFWRHLRGDFDAVIALYHDQGLAPLKTLEFESAVNVTLGLPHVRTSPDHGTAYGIAGRGEAGWGSLGAAILLARRLVLWQEKVSVHR